MKNNSHINYRPDIDGLRAVSILLVVIFHAFPESIRGGFIGVDVFFVISGYLISSIIFKGLNEGRFSLLNFYEHRIKRIFPALITVLIASFIVGWFILLPDEFKQLGKHIIAGAGFSQNFVLMNEAGYFNTVSELKPLMHLWSLAVEEQFYLLYPILILVMWRGEVNILTAILVLGAFSFGANILGVEENSIKVFFSPQTRFWELLAGSLLAYFQTFQREQFVNWLCRLFFRPASFHWPLYRQEKKLNELLSISGLLFIAITSLTINKKTPFPGWWALAPVVGAFLIVLAGPQALINKKILANRCMVFVGRISYPLYLWHWPLLSFLRIVEKNAPSRELRATAVGISFLLACLTYYIIEKPIRFGANTRTKTITLATLALLIACIGFNTYKKNGFKYRVGDAAKISKAVGEWEYPGNLKAKSINNTSYLFEESKKSDLTLFIGDSNIEQYYVRADELIRENPGITNGIVFRTGGGCLPVPDVEFDLPHKACSKVAKNSLELVKAMPNIKTVVIGAQWNGYLSTGAKLAEKIEYGSISYNATLSKLSDFIKDFVSLHKKVYLILNIPIGDELDPKFMTERSIRNFPDVFQIKPTVIAQLNLFLKVNMVSSKQT